MRAREPQLDGTVVQCDRGVHHGEVGLGCIAVGDAIDREGHVLRRAGLAVGEHGVVAYRERPHEAVVAAEEFGGQVAGDVHGVIGYHERGLDERLVHVLAAAPRDERIETGRRLALRAHRDGHRAVRIDAAGCGARARIREGGTSAETDQRGGADEGAARQAGGGRRRRG